MIVDKLSNLKLYKILPDLVYDFVSNLSPKIKVGRHELCNGIYANVETYHTKQLSTAKFETHDEYIDIQILLTGNEKIYYTEREGLNVSEKYNPERDITFYSDNVENTNFVILNGSNFVILFPHEAHAPQVATNDIPEKVLKVVIKVKKDLLF